MGKYFFGSQDAGMDRKVHTHSAMDGKHTSAEKTSHFRSTGEIDTSAPVDVILPEGTNLNQELVKQGWLAVPGICSVRYGAARARNWRAGKAPGSMG